LGHAGFAILSPLKAEISMDHERSHGRVEEAHRLEARVEADSPGFQPQSEDYWHVNLNEPWEIVFWSRELRCSEQQLREAVSAVGARAGDVKAYLRGLRF
jgi:hypothetical protein